MKLFVCLLALSLVSATICAPSKLKRGTGYGSSYGSSTSYSSAPVVRTFVETIQPAPTPAPVVRTEVVQLEAVPTSYGTPTRTLVRDNIITEPVRQLEPEYQRLCLDKKGYASVFYLPHPTRQSWYIQCDEHGQGFLKECPAGTIFTLNLVCENVNDLHVVEDKTTIVKPQLDTVVGSYNSAPVFAADANSIETTRVEIIKEAPEFQELCLSKRSRSDYGSGATVFYLPHPNKQSWYIQCDEHGRAFLKDCPEGTVFTLNLVCEKIGEIHSIEQTQTVIQPQLDTVVKSSYESAPVATSYSSSSSYTAAPALTLEAPAYTETVVQENPEFRELCLSKRTAGVAVFYLPHPTKQSWYIQCDEFGKAFLKDCPAGTIFTLNLVCENVNDLHAVEKTETVVRPQLDVPVTGGYNTAPVFPVESSPVVETSRVEIIKEAPEFRELCLSKRTAGVAVFYLPHPEKRSWYIQCDEFGRAFLKDCPAGTIFTSRLTCEKIGEIQEVETIVERPVVREQIISQPVLSYGERHVERPILREQVIRPVAPVMTRIERPILREFKVSSYEQPAPMPILRAAPVMTSYGYGESRPVLREKVIRPVAPVMTKIERPILREVKVSSYDQPAPVPVLRAAPVTTSYGYGQSRPVLREQVIRPVTVQRPIMREVITTSRSSY